MPSRDPESLIGRIAICQHGHLGHIESVKKLAIGNLAWVGVNLATGARWESKYPTLLHPDSEALLKRLADGPYLGQA